MYLYAIQGTSLKKEEKTLEAKGPVTDLAYSHDGAFLAVTDASKAVTVFSVADDYAVSRTYFCFLYIVLFYFYGRWLSQIKIPSFIQCRNLAHRSNIPHGQVYLVIKMLLKQDLTLCGVLQIQMENNLVSGSGRTECCPN